MVIWSDWYPGRLLDGALKRAVHQGRQFFDVEELGLFQPVSVSLGVGRFDSGSKEDASVADNRL